jgi:hypothetical protein
MLGAAGVTAMEVRVGAVAVTVSVALPLTPFSDAVIVADPELTPVARPAAVIVATLVLALTHVTVLVTFPVVPSL